MENLKEIIAGNRPKQLNARDETKMAGFLAVVKDKKSPLFNGASPADLLALGLDEALHPEKTFCLAYAFEKFEATCEKVSGNKFLDEYCIKNLDRLRNICMSDKDWLYKRLVIDYLV